VTLLEATEVVLACGHENVRATHRTTLEITKEPHLSAEGTCIIAVSANKALADLSSEFRNLMRQSNAELTVLLEAGKTVDLLNARGSSRLTLSHPTDMVIRKSDYFCDRTLAIKADKAACDLSRDLLAKLKTEGQRVKIILTARLQRPMHR
jgi:hypothetical protein